MSAKTLWETPVFSGPRLTSAADTAERPRLRSNNTIAQAVARLLYPLIRILLRHGVPYGAFAEMAKAAYVEVASRDFSVPGRKQSASRVAILTGLTRKEIKRLQDKPPVDDGEVIARFNRAARVISGWLRDEDFLTGEKQPMSLPVDDEKTGFPELVRRYSGDVPPRAVLDELLRVGAVRLSESGAVDLISRSYMPETRRLDTVKQMGTEVADLLYTLEHNMLQEPGAERHFQRRVVYDNLPVEAVPELRRLVHARSQQLLEELDVWLAARDRDENPGIGGSGKVRAGISLFYLENDGN